MIAAILDPRLTFIRRLSIKARCPIMIATMEVTILIAGNAKFRNLYKPKKGNEKESNAASKEIRKDTAAFPLLVGVGWERLFVASLSGAAAMASVILSVSVISIK